MIQTPIILRTVAVLREHVKTVRAQGKRIAMVPTMGALHAGHLSLVQQGLERAGHVVVSIFVNPTQFGPNEDFAAYPRTWESDLAKLAEAGAQAVFYPSVEEMYPQGAATTVSVKGLADGLCGPFRPGHFDGVATIVAKLLLQGLPDIALFGEKDYQQLQVIRRMTVDLNIPVEIVGAPTIRDARGVALSSRNAYMSPAEYEIAARLNVILFDVAAAIETGMPWEKALAEGRTKLDGAGFTSIDYLDVRHAETLSLPIHGHAMRVLAAVRLGKTRLIDNVSVYLPA